MSLKYFYWIWSCFGGIEHLVALLFKKFHFTFGFIDAPHKSLVSYGAANAVLTVNCSCTGLTFSRLDYRKACGQAKAHSKLSTALKTAADQRVRFNYFFHPCNFELRTVLRVSQLTLN